jgi:F0F1-type ATP synthase assembly protein I
MGEERTPQGLRGRDLAGLGGILVAGVVGGLVIGLLVDEATDSSPLWTLVGIAVGILLAAVAFVRRVRDALRE